MEEMTVRGIKGGVLISLPEKAWYQQRDILVSRIQSQERFFKGGRIALDVGGSDWTAEQLFKLLRDLSDEGVCLWAVLTSSEITLEAAKSFDLQTSISALNAPEEPQEPQSGAGESGCEWHTKPLEKGEKVAFRGNGVLIGDVPEGAEVIAAGSLIVWGSSKGSLKAGCGGSDSRLYILRYGGGRLSLHGQLLDVPRKLTNAGPLEIYFDGSGAVVREAVARKIKLL